MSEKITTKNSDLFIGISEKEQESVSGGGLSGMSYMFFQNTDVYSRAMSEVNISQGNFGGSGRMESEYRFSQTTFILASMFGGGGSRRNKRRRSNSFLGRLFSFF
ncbi:hypothetical protein MEN41_12225 [Dolichospermum sp. ST_con]|nr:hypothetical protein [Dolichospermum sp. ST_con]MDD1419840.1 hypothetical protein [Dolichospermum sp. ST_sed1]MDD1426571.1 hypothetical protein [Dolichospermum sp. ST_sed9]MDD1433091.1 hypothetical protein [Dolichospermum sp. ST_sed6]MDD1435706.1 hypothetical protein [Dolichospermum sp. ST_sed10]MDD1441333.1 hypothetical protein [Dolichospermum sp. ST_sed3]MDD1445923.1 hypothetical protein [Dolichospermum sp. ST_sed8]MDD1456598.1 hypothetical protein [Dolichospermum sp. ST_sed7]MDD146227